jgi:hypothetical protein
VIADSNGNPIQPIRYTAFGEYRSGYTAATQSGYHYTDQLSDSTINLYWYGSRWYAKYGYID